MHPVRAWAKRRKMSGSSPVLIRTGTEGMVRRRRQAKIALHKEGLQKTIKILKKVREKA